ncbi:protein of unknown function [Sanguibacter gelidistatuariae]|uniref:DUF4956 domain-containing protein n=1 Tax=Sanguibacter gelidistatuariae TaxID=1814289 RepID=A0A1G6RVG2_9MICO|nr:DUF4956 domain-containing protein [Sanguibacter gelidistatuariae]SDD08441.1 protein of unknown function [Sanguibacter gelidistatuariae]
MPNLWIVAFDLAAILVLTYAVYFRRHRRREMLLAYIGLNVGVLAVTTVLATSTVGAGLGLGLFGVLSIIRLRSSELAQEEVAYYFAALALGLIAGLQPDPVWVAPVFSAALVLVMFLVDSNPLHARYRRQVVTLDAVYANEAELTARLEDLLGGRVRNVIVQEIDLVRDLQRVDVRYEVDAAGTATGRAGRGAVGKVVAAAPDLAQRFARSEQVAPVSQREVSAGVRS